MLCCLLLYPAKPCAAVIIFGSFIITSLTKMTIFTLPFLLHYQNSIYRIAMLGPHYSISQCRMRRIDRISQYPLFYTYHNFVYFAISCCFLLFLVTIKLSTALDPLPIDKVPGFLVVWKQRLTTRDYSLLSWLAVY